MRLPPPVRDQSGLAFVILGAFDAVMATKGWKIFGGLCLLELLKVLGRFEVGLDLVEVSVHH